MEPDQEKYLAALEKVLDRNVPLPAINSLRATLSDSPFDGVPDLSRVAFGLDTNVLFAIGRADRSTTDLRDYLAVEHSGLLVLPGQAVQEFWNNMNSAIDTAAKSLEKKFSSLKIEVSRYGSFGDFDERIDQLMDDMERDYGYVYSSATLARMRDMCDWLDERAVLAYVPRSRFHRLVNVRHRTKTPPGFKDDGDGDFFVWADFLLGLLSARDEGRSFDYVVLITGDVKKDWSTGDRAHPILVAEVAALLGVPFATWTVDAFNRIFKSSARAVDS